MVPAHRMLTPRKMYMVPRVMTMPGTFAIATRPPFTSPSSPPKTVPIRNARKVGMPGQAM